MVAMAAGNSPERGIKSNSLDFEDIHLNVNWEDVICPICLDFPHNGVLLLCSSYEKGCRPFMCDTDYTHSNCLDRFKSAYGLSKESVHIIPSSSCDHCLHCPLCRGEVTGWVVIDEARVHLNMKRRCCEEKYCSYVGNYVELQKHVKLKHPHSCPSEIDPARRLDWENFQQSSEIIDVLSTIHAETPHGVVLGDYVIEYGDEDMGDDYEMPRVRGSWWTSCILCKVFNFRASRNRHRSRGRERRRSRHGSSYSSSNRNEISTTSPEFSVHGGATRAHVEFVGRNGYGAASRRSPDHHHSYRRRRNRSFR